MQKETIRTVLIWYLLSVSLPALFGSAWGAQGRDADTFEERVQYTALSPSHTMVSEAEACAAECPEDGTEAPMHAVVASCVCMCRCVCMCMCVSLYVCVCVCV